MKTFLSILNWSVLTGLIIMAVALMIGCNGNLTKDVHDLQTSQDEQNSELADHEARISALEQQLSVLSMIVCANEYEVAALQAQVNIVKQQVAILQGYKNITAVLDPCGDAAGVVDEVLLKLSDGKVLASFSDNSNGKNTRFSVLSNDVNYIVTDGSGCHFHLHYGQLAY